ncbi:MAG: PAS domain S-box protein [Taibaiella sp.]|nr:PAS domain S-box protein [Taibaiella sp.]
MSIPSHNAADGPQENAAQHSPGDRYKAIFENIDEGFAILEIVAEENGFPTEVYIQEVNRAFTKHTGLADVTGKTVQELIPDLEPMWLQAVGHVACSGEVLRLENYVSGIERWIDVNVSRIGGIGSKLVAVVFSDITERVRREKHVSFLASVQGEFPTIKTAEEVMQSAGSRIGQYLGVDACYFADIDEVHDVALIHYLWKSGDIPEFPRAVKLSELLAGKLSDLFSLGETSVVNDTETDIRFNHVGYRTMQVRAVLAVPFLKDGKWRSSLVVGSANPREWRQDEIALFREFADRLFPRLERAIVEDKLRESEQRYRIILRAAGVATWDWNVPEDKVIWNDQHYIVLGLEPADDVKSSLYFKRFVHVDDVEDVSNRLALSVSGVAPFRAEFRIVRADNGEIRWMSGFGRDVEWKDGRISRMTGVMYDITERKKLEQQKEEFIGIAGHELKTPVTSIKVYTEILLDMLVEAQNYQGAALVQKLDTQVERLAMLIHDLLDTTKIDDGLLALHYTWFDVAKLVEERVAELRLLSLDHWIDFAQCPEMQVHADRDRIGQVITNLVYNAVKYSPSGGDIVIRCEQIDGGVQISVRDDGIGIPAELRERIFERFFRVNSPELPTTSGLGLGLHISKGIIQRHGGRIWAESAPGQGSTFYFTIPYERTGAI